MIHDEGQDRGGGGTGGHGVNAVPGKEGVGLHDGAGGQVGNLAPVREVHIGNHVAQPQKRLEQKMTFLP